MPGLSKAVNGYATTQNEEGPRKQGNAVAHLGFDLHALGAFFSLMEARPRTGRYHQIRRHLSHLRHPSAAVDAPRNLLGSSRLRTMGTASATPRSQVLGLGHRGRFQRGLHDFTPDRVYVWGMASNIRFITKPLAPFLVTLLVAAACGGQRGAIAPSTAPRPAPAAPAPAVGLTPGTVDAALREAWKSAGIQPAPPATDATWLRRVHVDLVGDLPKTQEILEFISDLAPDKRARKVEELLASPGYAQHWTHYWEDELIGREGRSPRLDRAAFRAWLHGQLAANTPWDKLVASVLSATGQNGDPASGAVNYTLRFDSPQDLAGAASRTFLGLQIQCAQCHDHKTEKWKTDDFRRFTSSFLHARIEPIDRGPVKGIRRVELLDSGRIPGRFARNPDLAAIASVRPTALDGADLDKGKDTRKALAAWMTSRENPWFARAFVNRMWGHLLGRGFVDPVDDIRPSNPTTQPLLLDALARDFVARGFDARALFRLICLTEAYQLDSAGGAGIDAENKLWGRFRLTPLGPEELLSALFSATEIEAAAERVGIQNLPQLKAQIVRSYSFLFEVDEDQDSHDYEGNVSQALALINGRVVGYGVRALPGTALASVLEAKGDDASRILALYLRTLSRKPTTAETERWLRYVAEAPARASSKPPEGAMPAVEAPRDADRRPAKKQGKKPSRQGGGDARLQRLGARGAPADPRTAAFEDLFWTLLNSSEFFFNH